MPDTDSSSANGKYIASTSPQSTGGELESRKQAKIISIATGHETRPDIGTKQPIEPTKLYEYFSRETGRFEVDVPVALISDAFATSLQHLRSAAGEANELERENHVSLAWSNIIGLARFVGTWPAFDEAISMLFTAFETHRATPYKLSELVALQKVLEMLRRNPLPTDDEINLIFESLENASFDLNAPLAGINLDEHAEEL
jgi:hypothetical protein